MTSLFLNIFLYFKDKLVIFLQYWFIIIFPKLCNYLNCWFYDEAVLADKKKSPIRYCYLFSKFFDFLRMYVINFIEIILFFIKQISPVLIILSIWLWNMSYNLLSCGVMIYITLLFLSVHIMIIILINELYI